MRGRYGYLQKVEKDMKGRQKEVSHTMFIGGSGSGKNYDAYSILESGVYNGWMILRVGL